MHQDIAFFFTDVDKAAGEGELGNAPPSSWVVKINQFWGKHAIIRANMLHTLESFQPPSASAALQPPIKCRQLCLWL